MKLKTHILMNENGDFPEKITIFLNKVNFYAKNRGSSVNANRVYASIIAHLLKPSCVCLAVGVSLSQSLAGFLKPLVFLEVPLLLLSSFSVWVFILLRYRNLAVIGSRVNIEDTQ